MSRPVLTPCIGIAISVALAFGAAGCGGAGGAGGGGGAAGQIATLLGFKSAEGSKSAPMNLGSVQTSGVVTHDGSVASGGSAGVGDSADSYYLVSGIVPGVTYTVTLGSLTDDADVYVYQSDPTFKVSPATRVSLGASTETFTTTAGPNVTSFFVGVDGSKTSKGATFALSVLVKPVSEGTMAAPIDLYTSPVLRAGSIVGYDDACVPHPDACGPSSNDSFYLYKATSTAPLLFSISGMTDDVDMYVYKFSTPFTPTTLTANTDGGITNTAQLVCTSAQVGLFTETCTNTPASGDTYVIVVDGNYALEGAAYTINVIPNPSGPLYEEARAVGNVNDDKCDGFPCRMNNVNVVGTGELFIKRPNNSGSTTTVSREVQPLLPVSGISGCAVASIRLNGFNGVPAGGLVTAATAQDPCVDSYYVADTIPGKAYRLALEAATDKADLWVYGRDGSFSHAICAPPYAHEDVQACTFTADSTSVYFAVDGSRSAAGAAYTLSLLPAFVAQGTKQAPFAVLKDATNLGSVERDDTLGIATDKDSYYMVTGLTPGNNYIVSLPALSDDANLYVYGDDSTFTTPLCVPFQGGTTPENCVVQLVTGTTLYFAVDGFFTVDGGAYEFLVTDLASEGSTANPVDIGGAPAGYFGHVITATGTAGTNEDTIDSFYKSSVTTGKSYAVDVRLGDGDTGVVPPNTVNLRVYTNSAFTTLACSATQGPAPDYSTRCTATANASNTLYFVVDGGPGTAPFTTYQIHVQEDGSSTSVITLPPFSGPVIHQPGQGIQPGGGPGAFGDPSDRYYQFIPSTGHHYRITLSNLTQDVDLYVFRSDTTTIPPESFTANVLCTSKNTGTASEVCEFINNNTPSNGQPITGILTDRINIGVDGFPASAPGSFDLTVEELTP